MKYLLLTSLLFLSACATTGTKTNSSQNLSNPIHEEVKTSGRDEDVLKFQEAVPEQAPMTPEEEELLCSQEQIFFFIKTPQDHWQAAENLYNSLIRGNSIAQQYAMKYYDYVDEKVSIENFMKYQQESLMKLAYVVRDQQYASEEYSSTLESQVDMYKTYKRCEPKIEKALKSKQVDPKQKGCEWENYKTMVYDPYEIKRAFFEAIQLEGQIQQYLFEVNGVISKELTREITQEELTKQVNELYSGMEKEELVRRSKEYKDRIDMALDQTIDTKKQCEARPKK